MSHRLEYRRAWYLHYFDNKMGARNKRSEIRISVLFGFRKTIVDGTRKDSPLRSSLLETERWTIFYCNSCKAILNPQRREEKRSFSESFLHALLFLEKAGSTVSVFAKIDVGYDFLNYKKKLSDICISKILFLTLIKQKP